MSAPEVDAIRARFTRHVCQTSASPVGLVVERAEGCWIWDTDGKRYLDLLSGIGVAALGHRPADVEAAILQQSRRYLHTMVYGEHIQGPQVDLAECLAQALPRPLSVTYFTNSGAEAVEGALKTARKYTGRADIVAFEGSFHGDTLGALSVGGNPIYRRPFEPLLPGVRRLPFDRTAALGGIDDTVAAVIVEPVQAEAGVRVPAASFLHALRQRTREVGALLIADEVLTGLGRCGRLLACERFGIVPDLVVLAKALGGGLPLGAFVGAPEVMATLSMDPPLSHVTTFGGHPLSCAAGLASLRRIVGERLWEGAEARGLELHAGLETLVESGAATAVRSLGLLLAVEFPSAAMASRFVAGCLERSVLAGWTLHDDRVVRLAPPLVLGEAERDIALAAMREAGADLHLRHGP
jgi:acetylornithine/succinyldiaminopimelate/putrescine aminotransferase